MLTEEPPYLSVGTDVSAKYKGAFCEAKVRKVDKVVKCKIAFKLGYGSHTVLDNQLKGVLRVGAVVEARHPEKKEYVEGTVIKIQDCSQYTVVFDDGDITTLRRSALCQKSGRHFAESETLDQLPLTHPEHFGNPVVGRRGTRKRQGSEDSSGEERPRKGRPREEREPEIGKVVCVELGDKKKVKDNWFPGLVVSPTAQEVVRIRVKEEYLVRSFKDARYYTVPKKEATEFTQEIGSKVENSSLKCAVEKALTFLDKDELPPHWDREHLFSQDNSDDSDSDELYSDTSDDEPREEKDHFVAQLYKFMDDRGTPINACPSVCSRDVDLYRLFQLVNKLNGYNRVSNNNQWKLVSSKLGFGNSPGVVTQVKHAYKRYLHSFEDFNRKLGCTMVNHTLRGRSRSQRGRSLIRDKDKSTPAKSESATKKDEEPPAVEPQSPSTSEIRKVVVKEEEKPVPKVEEEKPESKEMEVGRSLSSMRKKFPTLKASPRTREDMPAGKRRAEPSTPSTRAKRATRENSVDDPATSSEEGSSKVAPGSDEQRSNTRAKTKEDLAKQMSKKDPEVRKGKASSVKSSDSDASKKSKGKEEPKKADDGPKLKKVIGDDMMKRSRKRRNTENDTDPPPPRPCIARNKSVLVGDLLKVYYGSPTDPNGIYEAKVIDIDENNKEQLFRVHYSGWNSRYDEWVKRSKIAENITGSTRRPKPSPPKSARSGSVRRRAGAKNEPTRSSTPSSITSSSSTTRRRRPVRAAVTTVTRRSRRTSPEAMIDSESDSDSVEESASDSETKSDSQNSAISTKQGELEPVLGKRPVRSKKKFDEPVGEVVGKRKPRITKKQGDIESSKEDPDVKVEPKDVDSPKGRDFDLNEIRSELKGIDKAVKVNTSTEESEVSQLSEEPEAIVVEEGEITDLEVKPPVEREQPIAEGQPPALVETESMEDEPFVTVKDEPTEDKEKEEVKETPSLLHDIKEDIYEFKEPEPFEFQDVRRPIRVFDDDKSPEKAAVPKAEVACPSTAKTPTEKKDNQDDVKVRFRRAIGRKLRESFEDEPKTVKSDEEPCAPKDDVPSEVECLPPQLVSEKRVEENVPSMDKQSPEPPCLVAVTEASQSDPVEYSLDLACDEPPRLTTETSSSDSESEERLVIDNDEVSSWVMSKPIAVPVCDVSPPEKKESKRSPLSEIRLKRIEDRRKIDSCSPEQSFVDLQTKNEPLQGLLSLAITAVPPPNQSVSGYNGELTDLKCTDDISDMEAEDCERSESGDGVIASLVCDEVIPGSPSAKDPIDNDMDLQGAAPVASVMENTPPTTPPTTPDSSVSSPREDRMVRLYQLIEVSSMDNESSKSHRDSSEVDQDLEARKLSNFKYENKRNDRELENSVKRKKCRRRSESGCEMGKRSIGRGKRREAREAHNSDSDTSEHSFRRVGRDPLNTTSSSLPAKYNFLKEIPADLDSNHRINFIQHQIQGLRKAYITVKSELATIERKRKKLRRKDREAKQAAAAALAAAAAAPVVTTPPVVGITKVPDVPS